MKPFLLLVLFLTLVLTACLPSQHPAPLTVDLGAEFTLAPDQSASVNGTDLTLTFEAVTSDQRCPIGVECYATGPVTVQISVQAGAASPADFILQTFTSSDGRAAEGTFEGIQNQIEIGGYIIRIAAVLPHPQGMGGKVKADKYRVTFVVREK